MKFKELRQVLPTESVYGILHLYAGLLVDDDAGVEYRDARDLVQELGYGYKDPASDRRLCRDVAYVDVHFVGRQIEAATGGKARGADGIGQYVSRVRELREHMLSRFDELMVTSVSDGYDGTYSWLVIQLAAPKPVITVH